MQRVMLQRNHKSLHSENSSNLKLLFTTVLSRKSSKNTHNIEHMSDLVLDGVHQQKTMWGSNLIKESQTGIEATVGTGSMILESCRL